MHQRQPIARGRDAVPHRKPDRSPHRPASNVNTIARRVAERGVHNRYQGGTAQAAAEITYYSQAATLLLHSGAPVLRIDTTHNPPNRVAVMIAAELGSIRRAAPATPSRAA